MAASAQGYRAQREWKIGSVRHEERRRLDQRAHKKRARVEQCLGRLKENPRVGTSYGKLATNFLVLVNLAIIRQYLWLLAPDDPSDGT